MSNDDNSTKIINYGQITQTNSAIGTGAQVNQSGLNPEQQRHVEDTIDIMARALADLANAQSLSSEQVEILANDIKQIRNNALSQQPDESDFQRTADRLLNRISILGGGVQGVVTLVEGAKSVAKTLGWTLAAGLL